MLIRQKINLEKKKKKCSIPSNKRFLYTSTLNGVNLIKNKKNRIKLANNLLQ